MANQQPPIFDPNEHLMQIGKGNQAKDYLPVQWRLVWFRSLCPEGTIETEIVQIDLDRETEEEVSQWNNDLRRSEKVIKRAPGFAMFRAIVKDGKGGVATGTKSEKAASFPDFIEKAETGAIGRALAALGYGTQFTGDEFDEKHRIVDSPVEISTQTTQTANEPHAKAATPAARPAQTAPVSENKPANDARLQAEKKVADRCNEMYGKKGPATYMGLRAHVAQKLELGDVPEGCMTDEAIAEMWVQIKKLEQKQALAKTA